jgi:predicted ATPase/class 3 adenylate cyclase/DNA-binding CsgD family transcriptional regulator
MDKVASTTDLPTGTVTFLLTDVESSTPRWDAEPEAMAVAMEQHDRLVDEAITKHGGVRPREQGEGGSIVAAFARASDAVHAALDAQQALAEANWPTESPLAVRMGIHTGEARFTGAGYVGPAIIRAARIRSLARGGQVLLSDLVRALAIEELDGTLLIDAGLHQLDGLQRPEQLWHLAWDGGRPSGPEVRSRGVTPTNLPNYTDSFVGRVAELAELDALVDVERLVTIVGPGGGGKTRLAHRLGVQRADRHPDGVWWLDLVTVSDPVLLAASLSQVLGLPDDRIDPIQSLTGRLGARRCLVILDNCEHMIPEVADLAFAIIATCPNVHLLVTSRASLSVAGEFVWTIPPLALPDDAVDLFVERARRVRQNFRISPTNESLIVAICTQLDGIPLSIELAAARCRVLAPQQILDGLENAIGLLTGGARGTLQRHQTIEASIAWSHGLLRPDEQLLLRRLSIFESPFSLDAVEGVCSDDQLALSSVLDLLERLADQSLVQVVDEPDDGRFRLLETVRQFGRHALATSGGDPALTERHTAWFARRAESCWPLYVPTMVDLLDLVELERSDILAALARLMGTGDSERLGRAALGALPALGVRHVAEADEWMERISAVLSDVATRDHGLLLVRWAELCQYRGDAQRMTRLLAAARSVADTLDSDEIRSHAAALDLLDLGFGNPRAALAAAPEVEALCRSANNQHDADSTIWTMASWAADIGDRRYGEAAFARAEVEIVEECPRCAALRRTVWAGFDLDCGRPESAADRATAGRAANHQLADPPTEALALGAIVRAEVAMGTLDPVIEREVWRVWSRAVELGDHMSLIFAVSSVALLARLAGDTTELQRVLELTRGGSLPVVADHAAALLSMQGDHTQAAEVMGRARTAAMALGSSIAMSAVERRDGWLRFGAHDSVGADEYAHRALIAAAAGPWPVELIGVFELLATIDAAHGWDVEAVRLLGAAAAARAATSVVAVHEPEASSIEAARVALRARLGDEAFDREFAAGATLDLDEAASYAQRARGERHRPQFGWAALTPTEVQVARLAGDGLTNPQIAERLLMGRETVKTHLSSVYTKTSVANRSQLAAAIARDALPGE